MQVNMPEALPYFYAAGVQSVTIILAFIASQFTKRRFDRRLGENADPQRVTDKLSIPSGIPNGRLIVHDLSPAAILREANRDRDAIILVVGIIFLAIPIILRISSQSEVSQLLILGVVLTAIIIGVAFWRWRESLSKRRAVLGFWLTYIAALALILANVLIGIYTLSRPSQGPTCELSNTDQTLTRPVPGPG